MKTSVLAWCVTVGSIMLAACSPNTAKLSALSERVAELESEQHKVEREISDTRKLIQTAAAERERLSMDRAKTQAALRKVGDDIAALNVEFAGYRMDYRRAIQSRAKGMALPDLTIGTAFYEKVVVSSATDSDLTVLHRQGMARIPLAKAPAAIQGLFGYDNSVATGKPPPGVDYLKLAIYQGMKSAEENRKRIEEMKEAEKLKNSPPQYLAAPTSGTGNTTRASTSFEGSYWAPIKSRPEGPVSKVNRATTNTTTGSANGYSPY